MSFVSALKNTVPISNFNKGLAGKIFDDVKKNGPKIVMKNNVPECVILSTEEYINLYEELENLQLLALSVQRMKNYDSKNNINVEDLYRKYNITAEEIEEMDEVEFE